MRRIFSEFLEPEVLSAPATLALLNKFNLQPLVALGPGAQTEPMARALHALSGTRAGVGIWPLLSDEQGYWPCDDNVAAFSLRLDEALKFAHRAEATVGTVVVDLEPPLETMQSLFSGGPGSHARTLLGRVVESSRRQSHLRRRAAASEFAQIRRRLQAMDIETFATVVPPVLLDVPKGRGVWQAIFQTPVLEPGWSRVCPMLYTSVIGSLLGQDDLESARGLSFEFARRTVSLFGPASAAALGLAGPGKLGDEPVLSDPLDLARDVGMATAAGIQDLALFSLDGVLARSAPEAWLRAFTEAGPVYPGKVARVWRWGLMSGQVPSQLSRMLAEHN